MPRSTREQTHWQDRLLDCVGQLKTLIFQCPACRGAPGKATGDLQAECGQCMVLWHQAQALELYVESLPQRPFREFHVSRN